MGWLKTQGFWACIWSVVRYQGVIIGNLGGTDQIPRNRATQFICVMDTIPFMVDVLEPNH